MERKIPKHCNTLDYIKALEEENKTLKEKLSEITMVADDEKQSIEHILELEKENKRLRAELDKLYIDYDNLSNCNADLIQENKRLQSCADYWRDKFEAKGLERTDYTVVALKLQKQGLEEEVKQWKYKYEALRDLFNNQLQGGNVLDAEDI